MFKIFEKEGSEIHLSEREKSERAVTFVNALNGKFSPEDSAVEIGWTLGKTQERLAMAGFSPDAPKILDEMYGNIYPSEGGLKSVFPEVYKAVENFCTPRDEDSIEEMPTISPSQLVSKLLTEISDKKK